MMSGKPFRNLIPSFITKSKSKSKPEKLRERDFLRPSLRTKLSLKRVRNKSSRRKSQCTKKWPRNTPSSLRRKSKRNKICSRRKSKKKRK